MNTMTSQIIGDAKDLPDLIAKAKTADPQLATQLLGKALLASKSPWGTLAVGAVGWAVSRYGLGWDPATQAVVAGVGVLAGAYVMRFVTSAPIYGIFRHKPPSAATGGTK